MERLRLIPATALALLCWCCAACQTPAEQKETFHEVSTPTAAGAGGLIGGAMAGPPGAFVGAFASGFAAELFISKGTQEHRAEAQAELMQSAKQATGQPTAGGTTLVEIMNPLQTQVDETKGAIAEAVATFWLWVRIIAAALAVVTGFVLYHYLFGSRKSKSLAKQAEASRPT